MARKYFVALANFALGLFFAGGFAHAALVLDEPLQGSTTGTRSGGTFVTGGWKVTGKDDSIFWHIATLTNGAVEWSISGLAPNECRTGMEDKTEIFHMYDYTWNNSDYSYAPGYRDNPYKHFVRKTGCLDTARKDSMEILWLIGANYLEGDSPVLSWNTNTTYVFREEWGPDGAGNSTLRTYRDGVLILSQTVPGVYAPAGHTVRIGASTRRDAAAGAPVGAIFSNVKVYNLSITKPGAPTITEPANAATVNTPTVFIKWNGDAHLSYEVRVNRANDPDSAIAWTSGDVSSGRDYAWTGALKDLTDYYAFVRLGSGAEWGPWSAARQFRLDTRFVPAGPNVVRVAGNSLQDKNGPFLGLGATYFQALRKAKYDRARLTNDLALLASKGFNYVRILSMVNWDGLEIAPASFVNSAGHAVQAWPDYWQQFRDLLDLIGNAGMRAEVTIFADAQYVMPSKADRLAHLDSVLANIAGRERKIVHLEVANEAWQNGFPGAQGVADLREFAQYLADRTSVPVAITSYDDTSNNGIRALNYGSAADLATVHFSRDIGTVEGGWLPVRDCYRAGNLAGVPPVTSNEPIGPGSSVSSENDPLKLCAAAIYAYLANLPAYVYHSRAGVSGVVTCCPPSGGEIRFESTAGINAFQYVRQILPPDVSSWVRNDGLEATAPFTVFCNGAANRYWPAIANPTNGCDQNIGTVKGREFVCFPMGILAGGVTLQARVPVKFQVYNPLNGVVVSNVTMSAGNQVTLPPGPGAYLLKGILLDVHTPLVPKRAEWKYLDNGSNQGAAWRTTNFNDTAWAHGPAQLGYGEGDEATVVSYGPSDTNKYVTTYLRRAFFFNADTAFTNLSLRVLRDDGVIVYLNGIEVFRSNMPTGAVNYTTFAEAVVADADENTYFTTNLSPAMLVSGTNLLAVELHQANLISSDLSFDLELVGMGNAPPLVMVANPLHDTTLAAGSMISFAARGFDSDGAITRIEFFVNGVRLGQDTGAPFSFPWPNLQVGDYELTVLATDDAGNTALSAPARVHVRNVLVKAGATWKYSDAGIEPDSAWRGTNFNDSGWNIGTAKFGYGDGDEVTMVSYGANAGNKYVTTYFRYAFKATNAAAYSNLVLRLLRDDGAIVYLNEVEVFRSNMPTGAVNFSTFSAAVVGGDDETAYFTNNVSPELLCAGTNILAVELHQCNAGSSDLGFNLELTAEEWPPAPPRISAVLSNNCAVLSWRTSVPGFLLQSTTNISMSWNTSSVVVDHNNDLYWATLNPDSAQQFYRLRKP